MTKHLWTYFSLTSPGDTSCLAQIENQSCQFTPLYVRYPVSAVRCPPLSCQLNACNINTIYIVYIYIAYRQSRAVSQLQLLIILHFLISTNPRSSPSSPHSFSLSATDAPVCSTSVVGVIGASLEEAVPIPCRVNSDPPEIDFEWTFSSSGEHFEVPSGHYATIQDPTMTTSSDVRRTVVESNDTHFESYGKWPLASVIAPLGLYMNMQWIQIHYLHVLAPEQTFKMCRCPPRETERDKQR